MNDLTQWEKKFEATIEKIATTEDPAHDLLHFKRVVRIAKQLCSAEGANPWVVVPAAWLHDFVIVPKDSPLRSRASRLAAEKASDYLRDIKFPDEYISQIAHAIEGHSFSAAIEVTTLEAKIVQDADRLDGLGAIGLARCFATAGILKRSFYCEDDPFCKTRTPDDGKYTIDHFFVKLFKTQQTLKTEAGRKEGAKRINVMKKFLEDLSSEIE